MEERVEKLCYTPHDIMALTGLSKGTVYSALRLGIIPHFRIGKSYIIPKSRFHRWLEEEMPGIPGLQSQGSI